MIRQFLCRKVRAISAETLLVFRFDANVELEHETSFSLCLCRIRNEKERKRDIHVIALMYLVDVFPVCCTIVFESGRTVGPYYNAKRRWCV
jgi:hypothetical protein